MAEGIVPYRFVDPASGKALIVKAGSPERAQEIFNLNRDKRGIDPKAVFTLEPVKVITPTETGAALPEPENLPGLTQTAEPAGKQVIDSAFDFGRTEKGMAESKDMSLMQRLGRQDQALGRSVEEGAGWFLPSEERVRSFFDKQKLDPAIRDMVPDVGGFLGDEMQQHDKQVKEGQDWIGTGGDFWARLFGSSVSPANEALLSSHIAGGGPGAMLKRMGAGQAESAGISAAQDPGDPIGGAIESVVPTAEFNVLEQIGRLFGGKANKGLRQIHMDDKEKAMDDLRPLIKSQLEAAPKDAATPGGSPLAYQVGTQSADAAKAGSSLNTEAFAQHKARMEQSRAEEYERTKTALGNPDRSATVLARQAEEARYGLSPQYTQALSGKLPNIGVRVERSVVDKKTGKVTKTSVPVSVPEPFREALKSTEMYDLYQSALNGLEGGLATATAHAGKNKQPTRPAVAWETIKILKKGGTASQKLAEQLQKDLGDYHPALKDLIADSTLLGKKERAADLAKKSYAQPDRLNDDIREAKSDPEAWKTFQDAFRSSALEEASKKAPSAWSTQKRQSFVDVLGETETARLEKHNREQMRRRQIEDPVIKHETSAPTKKKELGMWGKGLKAAGYGLRAAAGQGPIGLLAAMGPAASQFLKDAPETLNPKQYQALIDWYAKNDIGPDPKKTWFSTQPGSTTRGAAGAGIGYVQQKREEERAADRERTRKRKQE